MYFRTENEMVEYYMEHFYKPDDPDLGLSDSIITDMLDYYQEEDLLNLAELFDHCDQEYRKKFLKEWHYHRFQLWADDIEIGSETEDDDDFEENGKGC